MDDNKPKEERPQTFRQASRDDFFSGKPNPLFESGYNPQPNLDQLKIGALQRIADAAERIATALEVLMGEEPTTSTGQEATPQQEEAR